jgi:hypothetical protein
MQKEQDQAGYKEPYSYRDENYRPRRRYRKPLFIGGGSITLFFLLWNAYAISTWLHHPQQTSSTSKFGISTPLSSGTNRTQQQVNDCIQTSTIIQQQLTATIEPFLNLNTLSTTIPTQEFSSAESQLNTLQQNTLNLTNNSICAPLKNYNLKQIELVQSALKFVIAYQSSHNPSDWQMVQQFLTQYNENLFKQQSIVILVLENAHMPYQINANGRITYNYKH